MAANYHSHTPHVLDYTLYPGEEEPRRFIYNYLSSSDKEPREEDIKQVLEDADKYTLASHLFWGLWGIISGYVNKIEFDYADYSRQRFRHYWLGKPNFLSSFQTIKKCNVEETNNVLNHKIKRRRKERKKESTLVLRRRLNKRLRCLPPFLGATLDFHQQGHHFLHGGPLSRGRVDAEHGDPQCLKHLLHYLVR